MIATNISFRNNGVEVSLDLSVEGEVSLSIWEDLDVALITGSGGLLASWLAHILLAQEANRGLTQAAHGARLAPTRPTSTPGSVSEYPQPTKLC